MSNGFTLDAQAELEQIKAHNTELQDSLSKQKKENSILRERLKTVLSPVQHDTYRAAVETHGKTSQLVMAMEEMSELTKELSKNMRGQKNVSAISEEMADVEIMLEQLKVIFSNRAEVDRYRAEKLARLAANITGGELMKSYTRRHRSRRYEQ